MEIIKYKNLEFDTYDQLHMYLAKELAGLLQKDGVKHEEIELVRNKIDEIVPLRIEEREKNVIKFWKNLDKKFIEPYDIPSINVFGEEYQEYVIPTLIRCGAIPLKDLKTNSVYLGKCRNNTYAKWTGTEFEYYRSKMGTRYTDTINHFEDDNGYDLFVPIKEVDKEFFK